MSFHGREHWRFVISYPELRVSLLTSSSGLATLIHIRASRISRRDQRVTASGMITRVLLKPIAARALKATATGLANQEQGRRRRRRRWNWSLGQDTCLLERSWPPFRSYTFANSLHFLCPFSLSSLLQVLFYSVGRFSSSSPPPSPPLLPPCPPPLPSRPFLLYKPRVYSCAWRHSPL